MIRYLSLLVAAIAFVFPGCSVETAEEAIARKGGVHVVLEVDDADLTADQREDAVARVTEIILERLAEFGINKPIVYREGGKRIIVQLPGLQDAERANRLIGQTARFEFRLVGETDEVGRVLVDLDRALNGVEVVGSRITSTGTGGTPDAQGEPSDSPETGSTADPDTDTTGSEMSPFDTLIPPLPGLEDVESPLRAISEDAPFTSYLLSNYGGAIVVDERNKEAVDLLLATPQAQTVMPKRSVFLWEAGLRPIQGGSAGRMLYLTEKTPVLTGDKLTDAAARRDSDDRSRLNVAFKLDREGAEVFSRVTGDNIGRRIAIVIDDVVFSAPVVQSRIPGGEGRITGNFSNEEANDLAIILSSGALPAPVRILETRLLPPEG